MLHLSHLGLEEIPQDVFSLTNLVRLDIGWNQIVRVPDDIAQLSKLEELWLNNNPVRVGQKIIHLSYPILNRSPRLNFHSVASPIHFILSLSLLFNRIVVCLLSPSGVSSHFLK